MKYYPKQDSFSGGEITPRLYGKSDTERYNESLESMTNFIALPQGPAMRRQGFAYVDDALNGTLSNSDWLTPDEADVAFATGWDFSLAAGETATIRYSLTDTAPGGFYIDQLNGWDGDHKYLSSSMRIGGGGGPDPAPIPEPSTFILLGLGMAGLVAARKRLGKRFMKS